MALMASKGEACDRMPDCAIFAGTRWEPPSVYERVAWLAEQFRPLARRGGCRDVQALITRVGSSSDVDVTVYQKRPLRKPQPKATNHC